jgi:hypothetical protein
VRLTKEVCATNDLQRRIGEIYSGRRGNDRVIFLAAEESLAYEIVVRVVDLVQLGAGADPLAIAIVKDERLALPDAAVPAVLPQ